MDGVTAVIHTATLHKPHVATHSKQAFVDTNVSGTLNLLEAADAAGVTSFVFTSTTRSIRAMNQACGRCHRASFGLGRSTVHGVVFAFLHWSPNFAARGCGARETDSALQRERCHGRLRHCETISLQFLRSAIAAHAACFPPRADVLTFLRLPLDRLRTSPTRQQQNKERAALTAALGE